ncbi:hypothetical protein BJ878DRAFT_527832 [Calycina marina]|uniref:Uncharacterized protein n=1 Tax=Calycina marina TaxID=1763456 RepID=A0A9P7YVI9_9HELO|nr:hypothetical protein BJ878DRAFT_527832 [Calycina marina]
MNVTLKTNESSKRFVLCGQVPGQTISAFGTKIKQSMRFSQPTTVPWLHQRSQTNTSLTMVSRVNVTGNKVLGNKPASTKLLSVSPLVVVAPGNFLGFFTGRLRYVDQRPSKAMKGSFPGFWLDYSETPGKLTQMRVAKSGEMTNVCLACEGVNELKGEKSFCQFWRVLVIATRDIMPFDQLIRPS